MMRQISLIIRERIFFITAVVVMALICLAWVHRFVQDDAFISFRYAYNLAEGKGLVWNAGERLEGYTNFLWTLLISGGMYIGIDPIIFSTLLGIIFFAVSLIFTFKLGMIIFESPTVSLLTVILLGTNYTFFSFATGGMETQMQTALFVVGSYYCLHGVKLHSWSVRRLLSLSITMTLALLTRLDSAIMCVVILGVTLYHIQRDEQKLAEIIRKSAILMLPFTTIIATWFLWKWFYYGDIMPNTYYIKVSGMTSPERGVHYIYHFFTSYLLVPFWFLFFFAIKKLFRRELMHLHVLVTIILAWMLYIIKIGGDFIEFRFLVPILPMLFILFSWLIFGFIRSVGLRIALISLILIGSVYHIRTFTLDPEDRIEPVRHLHEHIISRDQNWSGIGKILGKVFHDENVTIATTAAGAIPYYSGLPAIDMYGINDKWIARKGYVVGTTPGHQLISPFTYLLDRKVNLVISHPIVLLLSESVNHLPELPMNPGDIPENSKVLEIPIDSMYKFLAFYLTPHRAVDEAIEWNRWKVHTIAYR